MYALVLSLHSILRWVALVALAARVVRAAQARATGAAFEGVDRGLGVASIASMDLQLLLGFVLYGVLSPVTAAALQDMGAAMGDTALRFWAVEHLTVMLLAVVAAHVGFALAKRGKSDKGRHTAALVGFGLSLLLVLAGIPWPFRAEIARPWLTLPF